MNKFLNPINYGRKIIFYKDKILYNSMYDLKKIEKIELEKFQKHDFNYQKALDKINHILADDGKENYHHLSQKSMASIHWLLFCSISKKATINRILEIGTFDGQTTLLLSKIFPNAQIITVDLPDSDPIFSSSYQRDDEQYRKDFLQKQKINTSEKNITLIKKNSFFLNQMVDEKFDLIWVDGGHLYPEISWDICNTYHLCNKGGWIMYDDVIPNQYYRPKGASPDAYNVLEYLKLRVPDCITYFLKRTQPDFSANPKKRKYVALLYKT